MDEASDRQLLQDFALNGAETAFEVLVQRHVHLVYSTALRQVGEAEMAKDVTQAVFIILARKASKLGAKVILPAWLYRTTRFAAADAMKAERRRLARELEATMMEPSTSDPFWEQVAPHLDDAMDHLSEKDRAAIVLRFFDQKGFRVIGEALGTTDDSAQKRVTRALEKLRGILVKRGVRISTTVLAGTLMSQCVQAAPAAVAAAVASTAVKGAVTSASILTIVKGTLKMMLWNKLKMTCAWSVPALLAAGAIPLATGLAVDHFKPIQVQLGLLSTGADQLLRENHRREDMRFLNPFYIVLGADKPASLRRVPDGLAAPLYGELTFGPREQPTAFTFLVDEPDGKPARLWVDRNANGDLTDDPPVEWTLLRWPNPGGPDFTFDGGRATLSIQSGGKPLEFGLKMYRPAKDHPNFKASENFLYYFRDYARTGYVTLHGKSVPVALDDGLTGGDFRAAANERSGIYLCLDLDGDGRFVQRGERFAVAKPFNIGGTTYEITEMSPLGETFKIVKSKRKAAEYPVLPDFAPGEKMPQFVKTTLDGRKLSFPKDYKGKLVLIDFWATWCGPCVEELPNVRAAYTKFHDQGFEILGISLDNAGEREALAQFTKSKGISWPQIYEGKGWDTDLSKLILIGRWGVPHALLVDGDTGEILATAFELRGAFLAYTVQEALKKRAQRKAQ